MRRQRTILFFSIFGFLFCSSFLARAENKSCSSSQEFVTTYEFLQSQGVLKISDGPARELAIQVASHCDGAARRFIETATQLEKMGVLPQKVVSISLKMAEKGDQVQSNFLGVLKSSYFVEALDLNFLQSLQLAYEFSTQYSGYARFVHSDFKKIVEFCKGKGDLPPLFCLQYAVKMARLSRYFESGVSSSFFQVHKELTDANFGMTLLESMNLSYKILSHGQRAPSNFLKGLWYALDENGLDLGARESIEFAMKMVARSSTKFPPPEYEESDAVSVVDDSDE